MRNNTTDPTIQHRCFVIMGFGIKSDPATGRQIDLNKSYDYLIKPTLQEKGIVCIRADEILHAGSIDAAMYQELLTADLVIADLSTANPNALYELGIRHALRPYTTIVISESKLSYPFDLNHILITSYTILEGGIDYEEVIRFKKKLGELIDEFLAKKETDSPIYTHLHNLIPPSLRAKVEEAVAEAGRALEEAGEAIKEETTNTPTSSETEQTLSFLIQQGEEAIKTSEFKTAKDLFIRAQSFFSKSGKNDILPQDQYLIQRLVLATYKAEKPDPVSALNEALKLLEPLNLKETNDPETTSLAGAIEKRLFELGEGNVHLENAIRYYERGYLLRENWLNGINLAYLLNLRANSSIYKAQEEKIADLVWANRVRRETVVLCKQTLKIIKDQLKRVKKQLAIIDNSAPNELEKLRNDQFWCMAAKAEAHFGLGEVDMYKKLRSVLNKLKPAQVMIESFKTQIIKLSTLLDKQEELIASYLTSVAQQKKWTLYPPREGSENPLTEDLINLLNGILYNVDDNGSNVKDRFMSNLKKWLNGDDPNLIYFASEVIGYFKADFGVFKPDLENQFNQLDINQSWNSYQLNCLWAYSRLTSYKKMNNFLLKTTNNENQRWILEAYEQMAKTYETGIEKRGDNPSLFLSTISKFDAGQNQYYQEIIMKIKKLAKKI